MRRWLIVLILLSSIPSFTRAEPALRKIATLQDEAGSNPSSFVTIGDNAFFLAEDGVNGKRLWFSDGTTGGTEMVDAGVSGARTYSNLCKGSDGFLYYQSYSNGTVTLHRANSATSEQLWSRATPKISGYVVNYQGTIYFAISNEREVWRLDPAMSVSLALTMKYSVFDFDTAGDRMFIKISASTFVSDDGMYVSDGTIAGTKQFDEFCPSYKIVSFGNNCAAFAGNGSSSDIFIYDPRRTGPYRIKGSYNKLAVLNNELLISGDLQGKRGIFVADDTNVDYTFQEISDSSFDQETIVQCGDSLYYFTYVNSAFRGLVRISSNHEVSIVKTFPFIPEVSSLLALTAMDDQLMLLVMYNGKQTLWTSGGTSESTVQVAEIGCWLGTESEMAAAGAHIFFRGDSFEGSEPWVSNGVSEGTFQLANINKTNATDSPYMNAEFVVRVKSKEYIIYDGYLRETVDGRARRVQNLYPMAGVIWHKDIAQGSLWGMSDFEMARPAYFLAAHHAGPGTSLRFTGLYPYGTRREFNNTVLNGRYIYGLSELMSYDGSGPDPVVLKDISSSGESRPVFMGAMDGKAYFSADDGVVGRQIWSTDGTPAGTNLFKDLGGPQNAVPLAAKSLVANNMLFFPGVASNRGEELWRINSSNGNTRLLVDINPGAASSNPNSMQPTGKGVAFLATNAADGRALWHSDGTAAGTKLVKVLNSTNVISPIGSANGLAFYSESAGTTQIEVWRTDGTAAGTISLGVYSDAYVSLSSSGATPGRVFYSIARADRKLYYSDGTTGGTAELTPFSRNAVVGNTFYYIADNSKLWKLQDGESAPSQVTSQLFPSAVLQPDPNGIYILSDEPDGGKAFHFYGESQNAARDWKAYP